MTLIQDVESVGTRALQSLKIRTAIVGGIAMLIVRLFHVGADQANEIATDILQLTLVLVGAQGLADFGKVGVTQAAAVTSATVASAVMPVDLPPAPQVPPTAKV